VNIINFYEAKSKLLGNKPCNQPNCSLSLSLSLHKWRLVLAEVNAVEQMAEVILEITLGEVARNLLEAVRETKERAIRFKPLLVDLESTVKILIPKITRIEQLSQELGESPKDEIRKLKRLLDDAKQLVSKCSEIACWDFCRRDRYSKKLHRLQAALRWLIDVELPVGQSEDLMRILVEVERIRQTHIAACSPFQILNPSRSLHPIGLGDHHQRPVDNDGIPRKELPVVSGFKRNWIVSLLSFFRWFPGTLFPRYRNV